MVFFFLTWKDLFRFVFEKAVCSYNTVNKIERKKFGSAWNGCRDPDNGFLVVWSKTVMETGKMVGGGAVSEI